MRLSLRAMESYFKNRKRLVDWRIEKSKIEEVVFDILQSSVAAQCFSYTYVNDLKSNTKKTNQVSFYVP